MCTNPKPGRRAGTGTPGKNREKKREQGHCTGSDLEKTTASTHVQKKRGGALKAAAVFRAPPSNGCEYYCSQEGRNREESIKNEKDTRH